ncbi:MAG: DUF1501 domain-containing protein [Myxococcales bacterium]|nr:DUF1501 domain-containing protein [Myxococcales bacterium]
MRRRRFLGGLSAAAVAGAILGFRRRERAGPRADALAPTATRALELFVYGGLCPWDTFYCVPERGVGEGRYLHAFDVAARLDACVPEDILSQGSGIPTRPFAADASGALVHLGPWTWPLWSRPDVLARARVLLTRHDQLPHATAIPLALTGRSLGRPEMAGTGASVERHFSALTSGLRAAPHAAVIRAGIEPAVDNLEAALAVGLHPSSARPLDVNLATLPLLLGLLERPATAGRRPEHDALLARYHAQLRARLVDRGGAPLRARQVDALAIADALRAGAPALTELLSPKLFGLPLVEACGEPYTSTPMQAARVAAHLLTRPAEEAARYVLWIDSALTPTYDGGHDSHQEHLEHASRCYPHTLAALLSVINAPGEGDPDKLELDDTLIAITSEFGRGPAQEDERRGLGHWPHAGVTVLIGGPVTAPAIVGAVDPESAVATASISPAELRMALLLALGVDPLVTGGFGAGDVRGAADELEALAWLRAEVLGAQEEA